jgi:hypothetical protein
MCWHTYAAQANVRFYLFLLVKRYLYLCPG